MRICTDTAAIVVYDLQCLKHRIADRCDWWSSRFQELEEINKGNVLFVGLGADGCIDVEITNRTPESSVEFLSAVLRNLSGRMYVGPAEEVTGEDYEPNGSDGYFIDLQKGNVELVVWYHDGKLMLNITATEKEARNDFRHSPRINLE